MALNKTDLTDGRDYAPLYSEELAARGYGVVAISAATGAGLGDLLEKTWTLLAEAGGPATAHVEEAETVVLQMPEPAEFELRVEKLDQGVFAVSGTEVERLMSRADLVHGEGIQRAQRALEKMGVLIRLEDLGAQEGDTVLLADLELEYRPDYI